VKAIHVDRRGGIFLPTVVEDVSRALKQLVFPLVDLFGV
jgi:hypothetical protein